ncbi:MAG: hypothetical protein CM1200mP26_16880 [Acidimicrobiales bacterium]|nr:MAG: hypothetical protein CM1200mP26_16880 [Acidimicrobiales bacterium]
MGRDWFYDRLVDVRRELVIAASPDEVWSVVAAPERQAEWFPGMVSSVVEETGEGTFRTIETAAGGFIREEVMGVDHGARRFEYRIIGPFRLEHHLGRITVVPDPCGSLVTYEQELEPKALTYVLDGAVADALNGLRDLVVGGRKSRSWVEPKRARLVGVGAPDGEAHPVCHDRPATLRCLGCNGGRIARTPVVDGLAASGVRYERAHPQNVVCMPSRATMLTGQHIRNHGVWMNGVPLPADAPTVAGLLNDAGWRTGLFGKAHFEPFLDPFLRFPQNRMGVTGATNEEGRPHRGFECMEFAGHGSGGLVHYGGWMREHHPEHMLSFYPPLDGTLDVNADGGGDTGLPGPSQPCATRDLPHRLGC